MTFLFCFLDGDFDFIHFFLLILFMNPFYSCLSLKGGRERDGGKTGEREVSMKKKTSEVERKKQWKKNASN